MKIIRYKNDFKKEEFYPVREAYLKHEGWKFVLNFSVNGYDDEMCDLFKPVFILRLYVVRTPKNIERVFQHEQENHSKNHNSMSLSLKSMYEYKYDFKGKIEKKFHRKFEKFLDELIQNPQKYINIATRKIKASYSKK